MESDREELLHGVKLAAVAVISAVVTASAVIGAGHALQPRPVPAAPVEPAQDAILIHTAG
ncbi:MAG: hypothetical protein EON88_18870 [Brevundimonas sp.]|nr:MAG: hypothetical protein EON88_18870 [Brevundimonas sp.]